MIFLQISQNDVHPTGVERKRSASQETGSESQKKKIKVIDIRNGSSEQESKSHGGFSCVSGLAQKNQLYYGVHAVHFSVAV